MPNVHKQLRQTIWPLFLTESTPKHATFQFPLRTARVRVELVPKRVRYNTRPEGKHGRSRAGSCRVGGCRCACGHGGGIPCGRRPDFQTDRPIAISPLKTGSALMVSVPGERPRFHSISSPFTGAASGTAANCPSPGVEARSRLTKEAGGLFPHDLVRDGGDDEFEALFCLMAKRAGRVIIIRPRATMKNRRKASMG